MKSARVRDRRCSAWVKGARVEGSWVEYACGEGTCHECVWTECSWTDYSWTEGSSTESARGELVRIAQSVELSDDTRARIGARMLIPVAVVVSFVLCTALVLGGIPRAQAQETTAQPTLTVHILSGNVGSSSVGSGNVGSSTVNSNTAGSGTAGDNPYPTESNQLPSAESLLPRQQTSAGAGYIYQLIELDPSKVSAIGDYADTAQSAQQRSEAILKNPTQFKLANGEVLLGESNEQGIIATQANVNRGSWIKNGTITNGSVSGGEPARFRGSVNLPTYWYLNLIRTPENTPSAMSHGVLQLPYIAPNEDGKTVTYAVEVYPKLVECTHCGQACGTCQSGNGSGVSPDSHANQEQPGQHETEQTVDAGWLALTGSGLRTIFIISGGLLTVYVLVFLARKSKRRQEVSTTVTPEAK